MLYILHIRDTTRRSRDVETTTTTMETTLIKDFARAERAYAVFDIMSECFSVKNFFSTFFLSYGRDFSWRLPILLLLVRFARTSGVGNRLYTRTSYTRSYYIPGCILQVCSNYLYHTSVWIVRHTRNIVRNNIRIYIYTRSYMACPRNTGHHLVVIVTTVCDYGWHSSKTRIYFHTARYPLPRALQATVRRNSIFHTWKYTYSNPYIPYPEPRRRVVVAPSVRWIRNYSIVRSTVTHCVTRCTLGSRRS